MVAPAQEILTKPKNHEQRRRRIQKLCEDQLQSPSSRMKKEQDAMKQLIRSTAVAVALTCAVVARAPAAQTFDLSRDFSRTSNPNGVWSLGWEGTPGGPFSLLTWAGTVPFDNGVPVDYWRFSAPGEPAIFH